MERRLGGETEEDMGAAVFGDPDNAAVVRRRLLHPVCSYKLYFSTTGVT